MTPSLTQLAPDAPDRFRLRVKDGVRRLADIVSAAESLAPSLPDGEDAALAVPARDPESALVHIEAALMRGIIPVPSTRVSAPERIEVGRDIDGAEIALATSGSTGVPRLCAFQLQAVVRSAARVADYLGLDDSDEIALLQPLDHGFGLVGQLFAAIASGAAATDCSSPYPIERAEAVAAAQTTVLAAVPHTLAQLAEHLPVVDQDAAARLRSVGSAGGRLPPLVARRLALAFSEAVIWNQYGCTEAGPRLSAVPSTHVAFYTGTVGRPIPGVHLWIADPSSSGDGDGDQVLPAGRPGEICFHSDSQMLGYLGDPEATAMQRRRLGEATGFWTGDLGLLDTEDRLHVLGRADDLVKLRGERVSLEALARAAEAAGARAAVALVSEPPPDATDGVLTLVYEGDEELDSAALARLLPRSVPMLPRRMLWVPGLPRLASGKIDRSGVELLAELASGSAR